MYKFRIESEIQHIFPSIVSALDAAGIAFFIKDESLRYIHANSNYLKIIGLKSIENLSDLDIYTPEVAFDLNREDMLSLTTELSSKKETVLLTRRKVERIVNISRSIYKQGELTCLVGVVEDVTELKQKEQFKAYKQILTSEDIHEKIINRFSSYIFNNTDKRLILDGVARLCVELLKLEELSIFLFNTVSQQIEQYTTCDKKGRQDVSRALCFKLGEKIPGNAALNLKSIFVNDLTTDTEFVSLKEDSKSAIAVPLVYKKQMLGVINTESIYENFLNTKHLELLEGIASVLAIKLQELDQNSLLKNKQQQLEAFIHNSPVPMAMLDRNINYIAVSERWMEIYPLSGSENYQGKNHYVLNPDIPIRWKRLIASALNGHEQFIEKEYVKRNDGATEWYKGRVSPWHTIDGDIGGVTIVVDIITEQVERDIRFNNTFEALQEARKLGKLFTWEFCPLEGRFLWSANNAAFGHFSQDFNLDQNSLFDLVEDEYKADFNNKIYLAVSERSAFDIIHPIIINKKRYWMQTRGKVVMENNEIAKIQGTAQDITEQISSEESLRRKNEELIKINNELDQFVYKTAHDLRAPLTNLSGLIGIMRNETDPQLLNTYFDLQDKSVKKLDTFIHKITSYTKNTRLPVSVEKIDFHKLMDDVMSEFLFYDKSEMVEKTIQIQDQLDVYSDPERLRIILSNLISNSIKFSDMNKNNPALSVDISTDKHQVFLKVEDNGLGISPKIRPRIFDMFYRGHNSADGSGIGLYIVQETVKKLNGKIDLPKMEKQGTLIEIKLPNLNPNLFKK